MTIKTQLKLHSLSIFIMQQKKNCIQSKRTDSRSRAGKFKYCTWANAATKPKKLMKNIKIVFYGHTAESFTKIRRNSGVKSQTGKNT